MSGRNRKEESIVLGLKMKQADEKSCLIVDDDLVVIQILSRLPVKSLMRFKSVCKSWKSVIEQDLNFMNLHYTHSEETRPGLSIMAVTWEPISSSSNDDESSSSNDDESSSSNDDESSSSNDDESSSSSSDDDEYRRELSFLSVDLQYDGKGLVRAANLQSRKRITQSSIPEEAKFLGPVRGLICFVDTIGIAVQICNVKTGDVTPWITSTVVETVVRRFEPTCWFGFDPATGNHKVMYMWSKYEDTPPVCEVLTVGDYDAGFRIIGSVPPLPSSCELDLKVGVCGNGGSVYWFAFQGTKPWDDWDGCDSDPEFEYSESLMAFDFGSEQFRIIPIPKLTLKDYDLIGPCESEFTEMDGCPTVVRYYFRPYRFEMWRFHGGTSSSSSSNEEDWTQVTIIPPSHIYIDPGTVFYHSIHGKDLMIFEAYDTNDEDDLYFLRNVKVAHLYSYSLKNKTFSEFKVEGISFLSDRCSTVCRPLVESLLPMQTKL